MVLGDAPLEQWPERPWVARMQRENNPRKLLALFVDVDTDIKSRISPFTIALGSALPQDPQSVGARDRGRDEFFSIVIDRLETLEALRDGVTPSRAMDVIRVINTINAFADLTTRGAGRWLSGKRG